jgi:hypothetical protein
MLVLQLKWVKSGREPRELYLSTVTATRNLFGIDRVSNFVSASVNALRTATWPRNLLLYIDHTALVAKLVVLAETMQFLYLLSGSARLLDISVTCTPMWGRHNAKLQQMLHKSDVSLKKCPILLVIWAHFSCFLRKYRLLLCPYMYTHVSIITF